MIIAKLFRPLLTLLVLSLSLSATATIIDFETFKIRNANGTISAPYDSDLMITENAAGDGFHAITPRGGQKVGYGTNAFNGFQINSFTRAC